MGEEAESMLASVWCAHGVFARGRRYVGERVFSFGGRSGCLLVVLRKVAFQEQ